MDATDVVVSGGEKHSSLGTFQVFEKFQHPVILELIFLWGNDAVFNVVKNTHFLSLKDINAQNVFTLEINTVIARACQPIVVLPRSITSVQVSISNLPKNQNHHLSFQNCTFLSYARGGGGGCGPPG